MTEFQGQRVVAGVDGGNWSLATIEFAAAEAQLRGLPLQLLAADRHQPGGPAHANLTALLRRVTATWPDLVTTARNAIGDPAEVLIDASRTAELVVVGRRPSNGSRPAGLVAAQVAAHARCPTVVVPAGAPPAERASVLVGLERSPEDEPAVRFAFETAALRGAPLLAVHVWAGLPQGAADQISPFRYDLREARATADRGLAEALAPWYEKYPEVMVAPMALYDVNPAQTLLDAGMLAGLMVVGTHRRRYHSSQLLGALTRTLLQRASCPLAVVGHGQLA